MRRNDQPSRPNAMTCSRFSLLKTWLMTTEANFLCGSSALSLLTMAAFHLIIYGRLWMITEVSTISILADEFVPITVPYSPGSP
jgi:hypothetical protein